MKKSQDDKADQQNSHNPGRRRFLKGVGMAGAGAAVIDKLWRKFDHETHAFPA